MEENQDSLNTQWNTNIPATFVEPQPAFIYRRPIGPVTFGLIILMFFFTFIDIKCNNVSIGTIKGYELATGYHLNSGAANDTHHGKPNVYAACALILAVLGFGLAFLKAKPGSMAKVACGFLGFLSMLILFFKIRYDAGKGDQTDNYSDAIKISVDFQLAFWIAFLLFIFAGVLGVLELKRRTK